MNIDFSRQRWERVKENYGKWWAGELERPLINAVVNGRDPGRVEPSLPSHFFTAFYDLSVPVEEIVDRWDYDISCRKYLGDSFPTAFPNFGPGVMAAFLGCRLETGVETVWFHPVEDNGIADIKFEYDPENVWLKRIKELSKAGMERWKGMVQFCTTDIGGSLDVVASFRPSERLLLDLYDYPEEVKRLTWQAHDLWWKYFDELNDILKPLNPGYVPWSPIFSESPFCMLQCDFSYMIGPDMFEEFAKPELEAMCKRLTNSIYHLDGVGELPHLDSILSIRALKGVQWVPGEGWPDHRYWPEVYRKIRDAGKLIYLWGDTETLDTVVGQLGSAEGIFFLGFFDDEESALACIDKYGAA